MNDPGIDVDYMYALYMFNAVDTPTVNRLLVSSWIHRKAEDE